MSANIVVSPVSGKEINVFRSDLGSLLSLYYCKHLLDTIRNQLVSATPLRKPQFLPEILFQFQYHIVNLLFLLFSDQEERDVNGVPWDGRTMILKGSVNAPLHSPCRTVCFVTGLGSIFRAPGKSKSAINIILV
jgi:hypothetical protein